MVSVKASTPRRAMTLILVLLLAVSGFVPLPSVPERQVHAAMNEDGTETAVPSARDESSMAPVSGKGLYSMQSVTEEVYASDLAWISAVSGWKTVQKDKNVNGGVMKICGKTYAKGIGTHANSTIKYNLGGKYSRFKAEVGIDDAKINSGKSSIAFVVKCDGVERFNSGAMTTDYPAVQQIDVPVEGVEELELVVNDANGSIDSDWADWGDARLVKGAPSGTLLDGITLGGQPMSGFVKSKIDYDIQLNPGTITAPVVGAVPADAGAVVDIKQAGGLPGSAVITVTKGQESSIYTLYFSVKELGLDTVAVKADKTELNPLLNPGERAKLTVSAVMTDQTPVDLEHSGATVKYIIESIYKSGNVTVATVDQKGIVTPAKDAGGDWVGGVAKVTVEVTLNGKTRTDSINIVVRPFYREYHKTLVLKMFMGANGNVNLTFEQALEVMKKVDHLTRGIPKIYYLVGWQYDGHDSKYPAWDEVNVRLKRPQDETAAQSLIWLINEAKKYNTTVSLHINMTTAFEDSPLWQEYVDKDLIGRKADGSFTIYGGSKAISYTAEWNAGLFQKRVERLLEMLPPLRDGRTIHTDAFHVLIPKAGPNGEALQISQYHEAKYGYTNEVEKETMREMFKYWRNKGLDLTSEFVNSYRDGEDFIGLQPMAWHYYAPNWYLDVPASLYCGGNGGDARYGISMLGEGRIKGDSDTLRGFLKDFCTYALPWYYLNSLQRLSDDNVVVKFSENVQSYADSKGPVIKQGDRILRSGNDVLIPALWNKEKYREIMVYSESGYTDKTWKLPADWADVTGVDIYDIGLGGLTASRRNVAVQDGSLTLSLGADKGASIVPAGTKINEDTSKIVTTLAGPSSVEGGKEFSLTYGLAGADKISAQNITLHYDKDVFEFAGAKPVKEETVIQGVYKGVPGSIQLVVASLGLEHAANGTENILEVTFKAKNVNVSGEISVASASLGNGETGEEMEAALSHLSITVVTVPEGNELDTAIEAAEDRRSGAEEGIEINRYHEGAIADLEIAISAARKVREAAVSPDAIKQAAAALNHAVAKFDSRKITDSTGDIDGTSGITGEDFRLVMDNYGKKEGSNGWDTIKQADINRDGEIGIYDLAFIARKL